MSRNAPPRSRYAAVLVPSQSFDCRRQARATPVLGTDLRTRPWSSRSHDYHMSEACILHCMAYKRIYIYVALSRTLSAVPGTQELLMAVMALTGSRNHAAGPDSCAHGDRA